MRMSAGRYILFFSAPAVVLAIAVLTEACGSGLVPA